MMVTLFGGFSYDGVSVRVGIGALDNDLFLIPCSTPGKTSAHSVEHALSSEWEIQFYNLPKTPAQPNNFCSVEIFDKKYW